ncbi:hypothetical protein [Staphylococcus phage Stab22]|nr:hypothetical protein [Staphylococcus phage Stab22]VEV89534.1 hypothetical protein [Staphylococcus phage Stab22]
MKLHLDNNIVEGTPEELVEYLRLLEAESTENDKDEEEEVYNDVYDKGAFYTVTDEAEDSALPVGAILQHQHGRMFRDSQGNLCIISRPSLLNRGHVNGDEIKKQRFELAKQLGIQLTTTTDFAVEAKGKYFKVTKKYSHLDVGDLVTIDYDEEDTQPLCRDKYGNSLYVCIHDLELLEDDEAETASTELKVGDRVKVLDSQNGVEGEATVTAVLEDGNVALDGISKDGTYLIEWANHVSNLEKIEEDAPMGYTFWYINGVYNRTNNVLKASLDGGFEDSTGTIYTHQAVSGLVKPVDNAYVREEFEDAKHNGKLLKYYPTVDLFSWT